MHVDNAIDLNWLLSNISRRRGAGRPRDRLPALQRAKETGVLDMAGLQPEKWWFLDIYRKVQSKKKNHMPLTFYNIFFI